MGKFVGKNSRVARILSLGIEHRTAVDPVPISVTVHPPRTRSAEELAERAQKTAEHSAYRAELWKRYSLAERIIDLRPLGSTKLH